MDNNNNSNFNACDEDFLEKYIGEICNNEYQFFLNKANVVGVALGYKYINNICTKEKCITVFVEKKVAANLLSAMNVIPNLYKGIKTDVVETRKFLIGPSSRKRNNNVAKIGGNNPFPLVDRVRPVTGGYNISNSLTTNFSGTMGCMVADDTNMYMLGNNHILSNYDQYPIGSSICQPSIEDGGSPSIDVVAILSKSIPIKFITKTTKPENYVDCAIAKAINPTILSPYITDVGVPKGIIIPRLGEGVKKVGRTTRLTSGIIRNIHATITFNDPDHGSILYKDLILTSVITDEGDSGAVLLDINNYAVGLLIGSDTINSAFCPIRTVLDALEVKLVTS